MKKIFSLLALFFITVSFTFSQTYGNKQLIPANHWIYDAIYTLSMEDKRITFADTAPLSVEELNSYLVNVNYDQLSENGKLLYGRINSFLTERYITANLKPVKFGFNIILNSELLYKNNSQIDWNFATDFTGHDIGTSYKNIDGKISEFPSECDYGEGSNFYGHDFNQPMLGFPVYLVFDDKFFFEGDFYLGSNFWNSYGKNVYTNLFKSPYEQDNHWPNYVYANIGNKWDNGLGISLSVLKEGIQWGRSKTGSIIYNSTFETDAVLKLDIYSKNLKYNAHLVEITNKRFIYLHSFSIIPFNWLKLGLLEGTMINGPFEFRYINPLMNFHSYASWNQYMTKEESEIYGTAHASSYMGLTIDVIPFKNSRFYINGCMNELQLDTELVTEHGRTVPDGIGIQTGFEYNWADKIRGFYCTGIEAIYTSPYLYYKSGADWSLYRARYNESRKSNTPICSWIGSPFGPDAAGFQISASYNNPGYFEWSLNYLFLAHGTNSFNLFNKKYTDEEGNVWDAYYPSVLYELGLLTPDEAAKLARGWNLRGIIQYTNSLSAGFSYVLNQHFSVSGNFTYNSILNCGNIKGNLQQGIEAGVNVRYSLF